MAVVDLHRQLLVGLQERAVEVLDRHVVLRAGQLVLVAVTAAGVGHGDTVLHVLLWNTRGGIPHDIHRVRRRVAGRRVHHPPATRDGRRAKRRWRPLALPASVVFARVALVAERDGGQHLLVRTERRVVDLEGVEAGHVALLDDGGALVAATHQLHAVLHITEVGGWRGLPLIRHVAGTGANLTRTAHPVRGEMVGTRGHRHRTRVGLPAAKRFVRVAHVAVLGADDELVGRCERHAAKGVDLEAAL